MIYSSMKNAPGFIVKIIFSNYRTEVNKESEEILQGWLKTAKSENEKLKKRLQNTCGKMQ